MPRHVRAPGAPRLLAAAAALAAAVHGQVDPEIHWFAQGRLPLLGSCDNVTAGGVLVLPATGEEVAAARWAGAGAYVPLHFLKLSWNEYLVVGLRRAVPLQRPPAGDDITPPGGGVQFGPDGPPLRGDVLYSSGGEQWLCLGRDDGVVARPGSEAFVIHRRLAAVAANGVTRWLPNGTALCLAGGRAVEYKPDQPGAPPRLTAPTAHVNCAVLDGSYSRGRLLAWAPAAPLPAAVAGLSHFADDAGASLMAATGSNARFQHHYLVGGTREDASGDLWVAAFNASAVGGGAPPFPTGWLRVGVDTSSVGTRPLNLKRPFLTWLLEPRSLLVSGGSISLLTSDKPAAGGARASGGADGDAAVASPAARDSAAADAAIAAARYLFARNTTFAEVDISSGGLLSDPHVLDSLRLPLPAPADVHAALAAVGTPGGSGGGNATSGGALGVVVAWHPFHVPEAGPYTAGVLPFMGVARGVAPLNDTGDPGDGRFVDADCGVAPAPLLAPTACTPYVAQYGDTTYRFDGLPSPASPRRLGRVPTHSVYVTPERPPQWMPSAPGGLLGTWVPTDPVFPVRAGYLLVAHEVSGVLYRGFFEGCDWERPCAPGFRRVCSRPGAGDCFAVNSSSPPAPIFDAPAAAPTCSLFAPAQLHVLAAALTLLAAGPAAAAAWAGWRARQRAGAPVGEKPANPAAGSRAGALVPAARVALAIAAASSALSVGAALLVRAVGPPDGGPLPLPRAHAAALAALALLQPAVVAALVATVATTLPRLRLVGLVRRSAARQGWGGVLGLACAGWHPAWAGWALMGDEARAAASQLQLQQQLGGKAVAAAGGAPQALRELAAARAAAVAVAAAHTALVTAPTLALAGWLLSAATATCATRVSAWPLLLLVSVGLAGAVDTAALVLAARAAGRRQAAAHPPGGPSVAGRMTRQWGGGLDPVDYPHHHHHHHRCMDGAACSAGGDGVASPPAVSEWHAATQGALPHADNPLRSAAAASALGAPAPPPPAVAVAVAAPGGGGGVLDLVRCAATTEGRRLADHGLFFRAHPELLPHALLAVQAAPLPPPWVALLARLEAAALLDDEALEAAAASAARELLASAAAAADNAGDVTQADSDSSASSAGGTFP